MAPRICYKIETSTIKKGKVSLGRSVPLFSEKDGERERRKRRKTSRSGARKVKLDVTMFT